VQGVVGVQHDGASLDVGAGGVVQAAVLAVVAAQGGVHVLDVVGRAGADTLTGQPLLDDRDQVVHRAHVVGLGQEAVVLQVAVLLQVAPAEPGAQW
jgi:hypothetical protein